RILTGISWSRHLRNKQLINGASMLLLDTASNKLASYLESFDEVAIPVSALAFDFEYATPSNVAPAGQGSPLLRYGAVAAGLGTFGLNMMVLTPEHGPRLHFAGVLTTCRFPRAKPLDRELCPGIEACGRCAAVCPADAIPRKARISQPLSDYRSIDEEACVKVSQPFGYRVFQEMAAEIASSSTSEKLWEGIYNRTASEMYNEITAVKEGVVSGCSACMEVCPVGANYPQIKNSPHRQRDVPEPVQRVYSDVDVEVKHNGAYERPRITWASWLQRRLSKRE
ncbi:MAG: hypothetical protein RLZZ303_2723, partial [Candidatus Hydrogenedentota bacterium]